MSTAEAEPTGCRAESDLYRGAAGLSYSARIIQSTVDRSLDYVHCALDRVHSLHFCWPTLGEEVVVVVQVICGNAHNNKHSNNNPSACDGTQ